MSLPILSLEDLKRIDLTLDLLALGEIMGTPSNLISEMACRIEDGEPGGLDSFGLFVALARKVEPESGLLADTFGDLDADQRSEYLRWFVAKRANRKKENGK